MNALANSYSLSGRSREAIPLFERQIKLREKMGYEPGVATGLANLADDQMKIGEMEAAVLTVRQSISICHKIDDQFGEAVGHQELGRLLAYRGNFKESSKELSKALKAFQESQQISSEGIAWSYRSLRAILMSDSRAALDHALKARELADAQHGEREIIRSEWLLGSAHLANRNLKEAESHLSEALQRDWRINMVDLEASILLALAKLRHAQKHDEESLKRANEALTIADRSEYRLQQAEIHNFLAQFYFEIGDKAKARKHAEIAKERAECGYVPALNQAKALLAKL
jgi:tetratricopeptide (TPR) repeat protein